MTYLVHGSFSITNVKISEYESKLYELCSFYNGNNIYVNYENMNSVDSEYINYRNNNKLKPSLKGILEVTFNTIPEIKESTITVDNLCKCLRELQRNKIAIDMIYDECKNNLLYESLQIRKQSYGDYESYKSSKRCKKETKLRKRSYTESEVLLLNAIKNKSHKIPTYEEYLKALEETPIPPVPHSTPTSSRCSTPEI